MDLKSILKTLKLNESFISRVLGVLVIVVVGVLVVNYFQDRGRDLIPGLSTTTDTEISLPASHVVEGGETLWSISEKYYGSGYNWVDVAKENKLSDSNLIAAGETLSIPDVEPKTKTTAEETAKDEGKISGATYEVVRGDSLWNIAERAYGDGYRWVEIAQANNLSNPNLIHSGNILAIPR